MRYAVVIEKAAKNYSAYVPDLPGCVATGATVEETEQLIREAIETARRAGIPALEAYPLDADLSPSSTGTGYVSTFQRIGFRVVGRRSHARPIMRFDL